MQINLRTIFRKIIAPNIKKSFPKVRYGILTLSLYESKQIADKNYANTKNVYKCCASVRKQVPISPIAALKSSKRLNSTTKSSLIFSTTTKGKSKLKIKTNKSRVKLTKKQRKYKNCGRIKSFRKKRFV